jgi:RNA polymerase sigma-70 factor (ECF subfamily)
MQDPKLEQFFERARPRLLGLAYRLLGSLVDAEDAVQDTFLKWAQQNISDIHNPDAWLTTICTRRCIDLLRSAYKDREQYVGDWLPEPVQADADWENTLDLAASLQTAFLLMLERLSPKERAAYLLREIFDMPYPQVAETLDLREPACRKLVSRAKTRLDTGEIRQQETPQTQEALLTAFQLAIQTGEINPLAGRLAEGIRITADSGGLVQSIRRTLEGERRVTAFLTKGLHKFIKGLEWQRHDINGSKGFVIRSKEGIHTTINFEFNGNGKISSIFLVRNPEKLQRLEQTTVV